MDTYGELLDAYRAWNQQPSDEAKANRLVDALSVYEDNGLRQRIQANLRDGMKYEPAIKNALG